MKFAARRSLSQGTGSCSGPDNAASIARDSRSAAVDLQQAGVLAGDADHVVDAAEPGAEVAVRDPPLERLGLPLRLAQQRSQLLHDLSEFALGGLTLVRGWA